MPNHILENCLETLLLCACLIYIVKSKFILTGKIYGDVESFGQLKIEKNKHERQGKVLIKNLINIHIYHKAIQSKDVYSHRRHRLQITDSLFYFFSFYYEQQLVYKKLQFFHLIFLFYKLFTKEPIIFKSSRIITNYK